MARGIVRGGLNDGASAILQSKTITPDAPGQTVLPDVGFDALSSVILNGDSNLIAENVKSGIEIFGVTGNYVGGGIDLSDATAVEEDIAIGKTAYIASGKVTGTNSGETGLTKWLPIKSKLPSLSSTLYPRTDRLNKPSDMVGFGFSSSFPSQYQNWAGGYPRSPFPVSEYPNQVIMNAYGVGTFLFGSTGRFYQYISGYYYLRNETVSVAYKLLNGIWLRDTNVLENITLGRYGTTPYSLVDIYTDNTFTSVSMAANTVVNET